MEAQEELDDILRDYMEGDQRDFIIDVVGSEDKEFVADILAHFKEQIDAKLQDIDGGITRDLTKDWDKT